MRTDDQNSLIAIVGISCRFPGGASTARQFWENLWSGANAVRSLDSSRWNAADRALLDATSGEGRCRQAGTLDTVDLWDADFYGITPREARCMDPQQRLALDLAWEAIEDSNTIPRALRGSDTGVFLGISGLDYLHRFAQGPDSELDKHVVTGNSLGIAAGRISYALGLEGPCLAIDTTCSSSLVAVHSACRSLLANDCALALAGGVNLLLSMTPMLVAWKAEVLSATGQCRAFDARADGFVRGEGGGMLLLKRLDRAFADKDGIYAIIRGSALCHDGASFGLTVPNGRSQERAIRMALKSSNVRPSQIRYVEAHGTGTAIGDPIEVNALVSVFGADRLKDNPLLVGSVKSNIGHLESAAGIAGLIKTALCLHHGRLPPSLHFEVPNPRIAWEDIPVAVVAKPCEWPDEEFRYAGVSAFGFSGTNCHMILSQAPILDSDATTARAVDRSHHVLALSAKSEAALSAALEKHAIWAEGLNGESLADLCFTVNTCRSSFPKRLAVRADSPVELARNLRTLQARVASEATASVASGVKPKIAFVFNGEDVPVDQLTGELYASHPSYREDIDYTHRVIRDHLIRSGTTLDRGEYPANLCLAYSLTRLLRSWGIEAALSIGHGVGEIAAATFSGLLTVETAIAFSIDRSRILRKRSPEAAMIAVIGIDRRRAEALAEECHVDVAAYNSPNQFVLVGDAASVDLARAAAKAGGIRTILLASKNVMHSRLVEPMLEAVGSIAPRSTDTLSKPAFVSSSTGEQLAVAMDGEYWRCQARRPIMFELGVRHLLAEGCNTFIEIGAHPVLRGPLRDIAKDIPNSRFRYTLSRGSGEWSSLVANLAQLWSAGVDVDWRSFDAPYLRRRVRAPTYSFQNQRYWIEPTALQRSQSHDAVVVAERLHIAWLPADTAPRFTSHDKRWLVVAERGDMASQLVASAEDRGVRCDFRSLEHFGTEDQSHAIQDPNSRGGAVVGEALLAYDLIFVLSATNQPSDSPYQAVASDFVRCVELAKQLASPTSPHARSKPCSVVLVTSGATDTSGASLDKHAIVASQAALWGLARGIRHESPDAIWRLVDIEYPMPGNWAQLVCSEAMHDDPDVAIRQGRRNVPRLVRCEESSNQPPLSRRFPTGTYVVTGASAGVGREVALWLSLRGATRLVLNARDGRSAKMQSLLQELHAVGIDTEVIHGSVETEEICLQLIARGNFKNDLQGVFHCAGTTADAPLNQQDLSHFATLAAAKIEGTMHLDAATTQTNLKYFVCASSLVGVLGSPGQANHACCNAFMDAVMYQRRRRGLVGQTINWGPWGGSEGTAARLNSSRVALLRRAGVELSAVEACLNSLAATMEANDVQTIVADVDWAKYQAATKSVHGRFLEQLLTPNTNDSSDRLTLNEKYVERLSLATTETELYAAASSYLKYIVASVSEQTVEEIVPDRSFAELGFDSLMAMELKRSLEHDLGIEVPANLLLSSATMSEIAGEVVLRYQVRLVALQKNSAATEQQAVTL